MRDRREQRRALLESILDDPAASHADRMKADEQLAGLEQADRRSASVESLSPEEALREVESLADAMPGFLAIARVAAGADPSAAVEPPDEAEDVAEVIGLQGELIAELERRLAERERALQRFTLHRRLPRAPEMFP